MARGVNVAFARTAAIPSDELFNRWISEFRLGCLLSRSYAGNPKEMDHCGHAHKMVTVNGRRAIPACRGKIGQIKPGLQCGFNFA
jgi:hypothetical protein